MILDLETHKYDIWKQHQTLYKLFITTYSLLDITMSPDGSTVE